MYSNIGEFGESTRLLTSRTKEFRASMEMIPRQQSFACLSLKIGCVLSAITLILYSVLSIAQCTAALSTLGPINWEDTWYLITMGLLIMSAALHMVTLFLTALMLVGTLREKPRQMRPWVVWTSIQVTIYFFLFMFWTTMSMVNHLGDNSLLIYFIEFLKLLIRFYMLMLVASYYRTLEEEQSDGERLKTLVNHNHDMWYNSA